eukprot:1009574-Rhodomonas_salina.3
MPWCKSSRARGNHPHGTSCSVQCGAHRLEDAGFLGLLAVWLFELDTTGIGAAMVVCSTITPAQPGLARLKRLSSLSHSLILLPFTPRPGTLRLCLPAGTRPPATPFYDSALAVPSGSTPLRLHGVVPQ